MKATLFYFALLLPSEAFGQLGCVNIFVHDIYPDRNAARAQEILDSNDNFALRALLDETQDQVSYWITADVLNIRSGPGEEYEIVSETYYGNWVSFYGKHGDWVAISPHMRSKNFERGSHWVNRKYLSSKQIRHQVNREILERKCSYEDYGKLYSAPGRRIETGKYDSCLAVKRYLRTQSTYFRRHPYEEKYLVWRNAQDNPGLYTGIC